MYHQVGDFKHIESHRATYCHYKNFSTQMSYLHLMGYSVISLKDAIDGLCGINHLPDRAIVLTFDDGYDNFYEYAYPVLSKYRFLCTIFLVSGLIGKKAEWLSLDGHSPAPLMNEERIIDLKEKGVDFGSHGIMHKRLSKLSKKDIAEEVSGSKKEIEALLGEKVRYFCYPYGDYNQTVVDEVKKAGYDAALTCVRGRVTSSDHLFKLPRMAVSFGMSLIGYIWKIHCEM